MRLLCFIIGISSLCFAHCLNVLVPNLAYFDIVKKLGGKHVHIQAVVKEGGDLHNFDPTFQQINDLKKTEVWIQTNQLYEVKLQDILQDTSYKLLLNKESKADPHFWLSFAHLKKHAKTIANTFIKLDPLHRKEYEKNLQQFLNELELVQLKAITKRRSSKLLAIATSHDALTYFCDALGIKQIPLDYHGVELTIKDLTEKKALIKKHNVKHMIYIHPHGKKRAEKIASEFGLTFIYFNPNNKDVLQNLNYLIEAIYGNDTSH